MQIYNDIYTAAVVLQTYKETYRELWTLMWRGCVILCTEDIEKGGEENWECPLAIYTTCITLTIVMDRGLVLLVWQLNSITKLMSMHW